MKTVFDDITALEKELETLAPLVSEGFERAGGPSAQTEAAIRAEARRVLAEQKARARKPWLNMRSIAAAAAVTLLLGGSIQLAVSHYQTGAHHHAAAEDTSLDSDAGLASLLLEIQGLDEESFFSAEGMVALGL